MSHRTPPEGTQDVDRRDATTSHCGERPDVALPFFAYGLFMPDQLGFERIRPFARKRVIRASVEGVLWQRDGVPLLELVTGEGQISGYLIEFVQGQATAAYRTIAELEPDTQYAWTTCSVSDDGDRTHLANALCGRKPQNGGRKLEDRSWDGRDDPFFSTALEIVAEFLHEAHAAPRGQLDNAVSLLRLQMAYGLLWASIERFCALRYSLSKGPMARIKSLSGEPAFVRVLEQEPREFLSRIRRVYASDEPTERSTKVFRQDPASKQDLASAKGTIDHLYGIRNNVLHRGKESIDDLDLMISATDFLLRAYRAILADTFERCRLAK